MLHKLQHYGIRGKALKWFHSYLSYSKQFVYANSIESKIQNINIGVPQGYVLGPLLFLVYINDISNAISSNACHIMLFADDTNLFLKGTDLLSLKRETEKALVEISTWFAQNKLTMSLEKKQYSIFHAKNKKIAQ